MRVSEAQQLKNGQKVFIDYQGKNDKVFCQGIVEGTYSDVQPKRNVHNVEYILISVKYQGIRSMFPSFCLSKI